MSVVRSPMRVVVVGVHGVGRWHLEIVRQLAARGVVELVGTCDPRPPEDDAGVPWRSDLDELLAATSPDVAIVATPIHRHVDLALRAARAGAHVLLEKPPAPSLAEFDRLVAGIDAAGVACQVNFQHLGCGAVAALGDIAGEGRLGELVGISAAGLLIRDVAYFRRSPWAGRRRLDGVDVVDGALTNPFAHAVAAALRIAGAEHGGFAGIELELHRANEIESDDTSVARLWTARGLPIVVAVTMCGTTEDEIIAVGGTRGRATWRHTGDVVELDAGGSVESLEFERQGLLENLVDHVRDPAVPLLVPLDSTRGVAEFVDAVRRAPEPVPIGDRHRREEIDGDRRRWIVVGADAAVRRAARELCVFSEQGIPWAAAAGGETVTSLCAGGHRVADYQVVPYLPAHLSPRPFLHPVRTLGGIDVSDARPDDHPWHLGVGVAVPDVAGHNFWGGATYVPGQGYLERDDHGAIRHLAWFERAGGVLGHDLAWVATDRRCLLVERRAIAARAVGDRLDRWILTFGFVLRNTSGSAIELGSPGSRGRAGAGYGGFFWRLPALGEAGRYSVHTTAAAGEERVNGTVAPWLAIVGDAGGRGGSFTIVAAPADDTTAEDPWFVRVADYPGFGSSLAWDRQLRVSAGDTVSRSVRAIVADGSGHDIAALAEQLVGSGDGPR